MNELLKSLIFIFLPTSLTMAQNIDLDNNDLKMLWTEEVLGDKALQWVRSQNDRSLGILEKEPIYETLKAEAEALLTSKERIPYGSVRNGFVYNFWQDDTNVRGLWRRTPATEYKKESPQWEIILDIDKLAKEEGKNWVFKGTTTHRALDSVDQFCFLKLSEGGKDAVVTREFDIESKSFVVDGFLTPEAKQSISWVDQNTLLISTDWGEGSLTDSGYPMILKLWKRGTGLSEAKELIRGQKTDIGIWPMVLTLDDGKVIMGAVQSTTFFSSTYWLFPNDASVPIKCPIPAKSSIVDVYRDWALVLLKDDWDISDQSTTFNTGDLVAFDLRSFYETGKLPKVSLVFRPNKEQAVKGVSIAKGAAILTINENVVSRILQLEPASSAKDEVVVWTTKEINLPGKGTGSVVYADSHEETVFLGYEGFLTPSSLLEWDRKQNKAIPLKSLPAKFDATELKVEQHFATSTDGTRIPYFLVCKKDIKLDGTTPTLLYAYGGFQISLNPRYSSSRGKLWLERGGAYVLANIRGGGEYGPQWHQAGLKTKRQTIYDDFIAIGEKLIADKVTSPEHLGIMGGSNGGLLMGVMLTQRPDLWNAVVVQVPLLDMLRYHKLLAGASWVDEYGSPDVPDERAFLEKISPIHNFYPKEKKYPTPFLVTSTKDDRVHPGHARKMGRLFEKAKLPFYYYENIDGGHSAAANQLERAKKMALEYTYLFKQL